MPCQMELHSQSFCHVSCVSFTARGNSAKAYNAAETSKTFRGAHFSPFVRAYVPELKAHGIDEDSFVGFIDGLNEAFVANPVLEAVNLVSAVTSIAVPEPHVQYIFGGISIGSVVASKVTAYARTKAYLKAVNTNLFNPAGLDASIMTTKAMMETLGMDETSLSLPPLDTFADIDEDALAEPVDENPLTEKTHPDDPRMRRIRALEGHVMPLNFQVPPPAATRDNFLKRMGEAHVKWLSRTQEKKLAKNRQKAIEKDAEELQKAERKRVTGEQEVARIERELEIERSGFDAKMNSNQVSKREADKIVESFEKQSTKLEKQLYKEREKLDEVTEKRKEDAGKELQKKEAKEEKIAQKVRWVVISAWNGEEDESDLSKVSSNSSVI